VIRVYAADEQGRLHALEDGADAVSRAVWVDLLTPTPTEEATVETTLGVDVPTRAEMEEIEVSSRLYTQDTAAVMTMTLPTQSDTDEPEMAPVSFVLAGDRLITVRYHTPRAFETFVSRANKAALGCRTGEGVLIALLETIVDRLADILERAGRDVDAISREVFQQETPGRKAPRRDFRRVLSEIGRKGDLTSHIRDSLVSLKRLIGFLTQLTSGSKSDKDLRARVKTLTRDTDSLLDHASFLAQKTSFLLEATLGMINIEQNAIIKIFSVAAVIFLPPTLIASIYGMNFQYMPELGWPFGYPLALALMVVSAILPYWYFKHRGWL